MRTPNAICQNDDCKKPFYVRPSTLKRGNGKYCSEVCYAKVSNRKESRKYPYETKCECCLNKFTVYSARAGRRRFCSKSCAVKNSNKNRKGITYNAKVSFRKRLIDKYGMRCMKSDCTYYKIVQAHHLEEKSKGGKDTIENGILLCPNHHAEFHAGFISLKELFESKQNIDNQLLDSLAHRQVKPS